MSDYLIVTRHDDLAHSLRGKSEDLANAERIEHVTDAAQIQGKIVVGVLPQHLRPLADEFIHYSEIGRRTMNGPIPEGEL